MRLVSRYCRTAIRHGVQAQVSTRPGAKSSEEGFMSSPAQTSTVEAQPLVAVRNVRVRAAGMGACSEQTRFPITRTATCTIGSGAPADCYFSSTLGTRKTIPISSTPTRRLLDMASCCGSRSKISTPRSSALAGWARRLSKTLTSILRPDTGRFGCAIWTGMWWRSPVQTVKAALKTRLSGDWACNNG